MAYFEHKLIGHGGSNIIFLGGFRMHFESWERVYPAVAKANKVLLINRAGVGSSPKAQGTQTGSFVVEQLRHAASEAGLEPPFLLVAHSLGGIFANLYARTFPSEVVGVVFVESLHPQEITAQKKLKPPVLLRAMNDAIKYIEKMFDKYKFSEDECIDDTIQEIEIAGAFPEIPIAVVSGGRKMPLVPQHAFELHTQFQIKLLELSNQSKQFMCETSGHFPQITQSDIVVIAIEQVLALIDRAKREQLTGPF